MELLEKQKDMMLTLARSISEVKLDAYPSFNAAGERLARWFSFACTYLSLADYASIVWQIPHVMRLCSFERAQV